MSKQSKAIKNYTHEQVKQLCGDLIKRVTPVYQTQKATMAVGKTTLSTYQLLAAEINAASASQKHTAYVMNASWLRDLFTNH